MRKTSTDIKVNPIQKETVPEKIIKQIKELIDSGKLQPGNRLPAERTLAKMLDVGRPALREALKALIILGVLKNKSREGTFLAENTDQWQIDPISIMLSVKKGALIDIFEARTSLEMTIANKAPKRRTETDIEILEKIITKMKLAEKSPEYYVILDQQFHEALAVAAKNKIILDLMKKLNRLYFSTRNSLYQYPEKSGMELVINAAEHEEILKYVIEGNSRKTTTCMRNHLEGVRKALPAIS